MLQNLSSAAVVIGALRVNPLHAVVFFQAFIVICRFFFFKINFYQKFFQVSIGLDQDQNRHSPAKVIRSRLKSQLVIKAPESQQQQMTNFEIILLIFFL